MEIHKGTTGPFVIPRVSTCPFRPWLANNVALRGEKYQSREIKGTRCGMGEKDRRDVREMYACAWRSFKVKWYKMGGGGVSCILLWGDEWSNLDLEIISSCSVLWRFEFYLKYGVFEGLRNLDGC